MGTSHTCPVCRKTIWISGQEGNQKPPYFPFCSKRCKLVDLGAWLDGHYRIVSPLKPDDNPSPEDGR